MDCSPSKQAQPSSGLGPWHFREDRVDFVNGAVQREDFSKSKARVSYGLGATNKKSPRVADP
jgi:hypothetical protein